MYKIKITALSDLPAADTFLTKEEQRCYDSFKIDKRKNDWALGRYTLKSLIREEFPAADFKDIEILKLDDGRPEVKIKGIINNTLQVSISHSNGVGAAAISLAGPVGIDLEKIEKRSLAWAQFSFHPSEYKANDTDEFLTSLWAKKEAVVKYLGIGLSVGMYDIRFVGGAIHFYGKAKERWIERGGQEIILDINKDYAGFITAVAYSK